MFRTAIFLLASVMVTTNHNSMADQAQFDMNQVELDIFGPPPPRTTTESPKQDLPLCKTPSGKNGVCAHADECKKSVSVSKGGNFRNFNRNSRCPINTVCCPYETEKEFGPDASYPRYPPVKNEPKYDDDVHHIDDGNQDATPTCGLRENGNTPWFVIIKDASKRWRYPTISQGARGGGTLIHPTVVLTAAHTVQATGHLQVLAGVDTVEPIQTRDIQEVVVHENYSFNNLFNDIALVFLTAPVDLSPRLNVACLPRADSMPPARCLAFEWTQISRYGDKGIKTVNVPVVSRQRCQSHYRNTRLGSYFNLHESFMCAGGDRAREICSGDGGFPLVCPTEDGRTVQHGIVAWDIECGSYGNPTVYVDVARFRRWIDHHVELKGLSPTVYSYD